MILNIPQYDGPGVYSLEDEQGRVYVGSTKHIRRRLEEHKSQMNHGRSPRQLQEAHNNGVHFTAHLIRELPSSTTQEELHRLEAQVIKDFKNKGVLYYNKSRVHSDDPWLTDQKTKISEARKRANKKWDNANMDKYARIQVIVKKEEQKLISEYAKKQKKSTSTFIKETVLAAIDNGNPDGTIDGRKE